MYILNKLKQEMPETELEGLLIHASMEFQRQRAIERNLQLIVEKDGQLVWVSAKEFFGE